MSEENPLEAVAISVSLAAQNARLQLTVSQYEIAYERELLHKKWYRFAFGLTLGFALVVIFQ